MFFLAVSGVSKATLLVPDMPQLIQLGVGVRPNELLAIRWEDLWLDAEIPVILVTGTRAKDDDGNWHRQDWTKGDRGQVAKIQPIALPAYLVQLFQSLRKSTATMIKKSAGLEAAAEQLRHSSSSITREYYIQEELQMVDNPTSFDNVFPAEGRAHE